MKHFFTLFLSLFLVTTLVYGGAGSLWNKSSSAKNMFSDNTATRVGDIVTVLIQENATVSASKSSSASKTNSAADTITSVLQSSADLGLAPRIPLNAWDTDTQFSGNGSISDVQSAESRMSVVVIDRLPNGNLLIEGMRRVTMANEINFAVLRGYIRPTDIQQDNTILSSRIADAQIDFIAEGSLTEAQRKGWLSRLQSYINPF